MTHYEVYIICDSGDVYIDLRNDFDYGNALLFILLWLKVSHELQNQS